MSKKEDEIHEVLYKSMKGFGTDEKKLYAALEQVKDQEHWEKIKADFKKAYPKFEGGDLDSAICDELSDEEEKKYRAILQKKGISIKDPPADEIHNVLFKAMDGFGTNEAKIYEALERLKDQAHWESVKQKFKKKYPKMKGGDLDAALRSELSNKEEDKYRAILKKKGISVETPPQAAGPAAPPASAPAPAPAPAPKPSSTKPSTASSRPQQPSYASRLLEEAERKGPGPLTVSVHVSGEIYGCKENLELWFEEVPYLGELRASIESNFQREATRQCPPATLEQHIAVSRILVRAGADWEEVFSSDQLYAGCQLYAVQASDLSGPSGIPAASPPRSRYVVPGAAPATQIPPPPQPYHSAAGGYHAPAPPSAPHQQGYYAPAPGAYPPPGQYHRSAAPGYMAETQPPVGGYRSGSGSGGSPEREQLQRRYEEARRRAESAKETARAAEADASQLYYQLQSSPR